MVKLIFDSKFKYLFSKFKDQLLKGKIIKQIDKIKQNPEIGKPMKHNRKGTREVYVSSFRLSYSYDRERDILYVLDLYHKDIQ